MNRDEQLRRRATRQLGAVLACVALIYVHSMAGLAALAALCIAWPPAVPLRPLRPLAVLKVYAPWAVLWVGIAIGYLRTMAWFGHRVEPQQALVDLVENGAAQDGFWFSIVTIVVLAPVLEELVFRGYLFTALQQFAPRAVTHLVTAVLFGLAHQLDHAVPIAALSLAFGHLRERHGSLLPSMLAHALHNGATVGLMLWWPGLLDLFYDR